MTNSLLACSTATTASRRIAVAAIAAISLALAIRGATAQPAELPTQKQAQEVCRHVATRGSAIWPELVANGVLDANNDGIEDDVRVDREQLGTAGGDGLEIRRRGAPKDSEPIKVSRVGWEWKDYWAYGARWLRYGGRIYTLYFAAETLRDAVALGYIDKNNMEHIVCAFSSVEDERLVPARSDAVQLCERVRQDQVHYIEPTKAEEETSRRETELVGRLRVDFRNNGTPEELALLSNDSGAARGCEFKYYDTISANQLGPNGAARTVLLQAQKIDLRVQSLKEYSDPKEGKYIPYLDPPHCGDVTPRWFELGGKIYLDESAARDDRMLPRFRDVTLIQREHLTLECRGNYSVRWAVKNMVMPFK
jgi:hypothetical protein